MKSKLKNVFKKQNENRNENFEMKNESMRKEYERRRREVLNDREDDRWYDKKNEQWERLIEEALKRRGLDGD